MKKLYRYAQATLNSKGYYDFELDSSEVFREAFKETIGIGRTQINLEFTITELQENKTNQQLRYWKGCLKPIAYIGFRDLGWEWVKNADDAEYELKMMFYHDEVQTSQGINKRPKSLADASKEDLSDLIDQCIQFINSELGCNVMSPSEWEMNKSNQLT